MYKISKQTKEDINKVSRKCRSVKIGEVASTLCLEEPYWHELDRLAEKNGVNSANLLASQVLSQLTDSTSRKKTRLVRTFVVSALQDELYVAQQSTAKFRNENASLHVASATLNERLGVSSARINNLENSNQRLRIENAKLSNPSGFFSGIKGYLGIG